MVVESDIDDTSAVQRAFSKQSVHYDAHDQQNRVLQDMRHQVYRHVSRFMNEKCSILELNAGTGIDALHFAELGHTVHATDLSDGMISEIEKKINLHGLEHRLTCQKLSFDHLNHLDGKKFDYIFSNFGGLNCIDDLSRVTLQFPCLLNPGAHVTWVIMPPVCLWELVGVIKGQGQHTLRRFHKNGTMAHLEGEYFKTFYHPLSKIKAAFGPRFKLKKSEGLCAFSPPPSRENFPSDHPYLYPSLRRIDSVLQSTFPFNRWADHIITTFQFQG